MITICRSHRVPLVLQGFSLNCTLTRAPLAITLSLSLSHYTSSCCHGDGGNQASPVRANALQQTISPHTHAQSTRSSSSDPVLCSSPANSLLICSVHHFSLLHKYVLLMIRCSHSVLSCFCLLHITSQKIPNVRCFYGGSASCLFAFCQ